jgi:adenylate cyclase
MSAESFKRKLTAILSADVKGYSRLMGENETETVRTLTSYRKIMDELIQQHRGRVIDSPGDNILAEFGSVVDAVKCAVKIQETLKGKNAELPENRRMDFRIGVNLGDVIEEEDRIYGDGVNIAARLEGLAEAGGICISGTAFDQVKNKVSVGYQYLGKQTVKNIPDPVRVYKVLMEPEAAGKVIGAVEPRQIRWGWKAVAAVAVLVLVSGALVWNSYFRPPPVEPASKDKMAYPLPDLPSIAVLPFVNMSGDPKQEFLSDGITENIITALSKVPDLFLIGRTSVFTYKGKPINVKQASEELGVQYVLEGSVQRSADRIRITTQLIDALNGHQIWAERYDRDVTNLFALQDEITLKILKAIQVKLTGGETTSGVAYTGDKQDLDCYLKEMEGMGHVVRVNIEENNVARRMGEEAMAMCPERLKPYYLMANIHYMDYWLGTGKSPRESIDAGIELAQNSITVDDRRAEAHGLLGLLYCLRKEWDKAIAEGERAVALNPSGVLAKFQYARILLSAGRPEEARLLLEQEIRHNPVCAASFYFYGNALQQTGRFEEAVSAYKKTLQREPNNFFAHVDLTATYSMMGRGKEAQTEAAEVLRLNPKFSLDSFGKVLSSTSKDQAGVEKYITALRKAGLPDKPPLPLPEKPSIVVLPFVNMSDDKGQDYFTDGLTEEIITALSKTPKIFVIARNSSFVYKGKPVNVQQVSRELGVKYVLEGSVRRSGDQLRITAQLIDATTSNHIWAERYERAMGEIFAVQDEITLAIVRALRVTLTSGEQARLIGKGTKNLEAYLKAIEANEQFNQMNRQGSLKAKEFAREAISLDPKYAFPYAILANAYMLDAWFLFAESYEESMKRADDAAHKALSLDDNDPYIQSALTNLYVMQRKHEKAIASAERALATGPSASRSQSSMGIALYFSCRFNEAIPFFEEAIRMDPYPPGPWFRLLAGAYNGAERHDEALKTYENALKLNSNDIFTHLSLAALYVELGRDEQARAEVREVLRLHPKFSLDYFAKTLTFKDQSFVNRRLELMRRAGLK